jgi:hypothetical protein
MKMINGKDLTLKNYRKSLQPSTIVWNVKMALKKSIKLLLLKTSRRQ